MQTPDTNTIKTTVIINAELWHQVSIRAAELRITKRGFLEKALEEQLKKGDPQKHPGG